MRREQFEEEIFKTKTKKAWDDFAEKDEDYITTRKKFQPEFYNHYLIAFENYISGNWEKAKDGFDLAMVIQI
jgi:hypothetical protein